MISLSNFYQSKDWVNLMKLIKLQRVNKQGEIICEYCGKPITKKYDCIGHHKVYLTEENVTDAAVSLNPDNIALVHHKCHNLIHNKLAYHTKQVFLVYGSPLSGKSTFVKNNMNRGDIVLDIDNIWQCMSYEDKYIKPGRLKQNVFSIRDFILDMIRVRQGNWLNAYVIGGYPLISERERLIKSLSAREIFIDTPMEECLSRIDERNPEWEKYIKDWWEKFSK